MECYILTYAEFTNAVFAICVPCWIVCLLDTEPLYRYYTARVDVQHFVVDKAN
jgi:hypothetical protein